MKNSDGVEWAIHCCAMLASLPPENRLSKTKLAEFFELPEHYLAKIMQQLSHAGLISSTRGAHGGYRLSKPAKEVSMLEIVQAIDGKTPFFRCSEIRQCGPSAVSRKLYPRPCSIARTMWKAEAAWQKELASVSLEDIWAQGIAEMPAEQLEKSAAWINELST